MSYPSQDGYLGSPLTQAMRLLHGISWNDVSISSRWTWVNTNPRFSYKVRISKKETCRSWHEKCFLIIKSAWMHLFCGVEKVFYAHVLVSIVLSPAVQEFPKYRLKSKNPFQRSNPSADLILKRLYTTMASTVCRNTTSSQSFSINPSFQYLRITLE